MNDQEQDIIIPPQLGVSKSCSASWKPILFPSRCSSAKIKAAVFGLLPVLSWLPKYKIKNYIIPDLLGGLSGGSIQVPQGEGVSVLGRLGLLLYPLPLLVPYDLRNPTMPLSLQSLCHLQAWHLLCWPTFLPSTVSTPLSSPSSPTSSWGVSTRWCQVRPLPSQQAR